MRLCVRLDAIFGFDRFYAPNLFCGPDRFCGQTRAGGLCRIFFPVRTPGYHSAAGQFPGDFPRYLPSTVHSQKMSLLNS
jgi:hypothetical protein